MEVMRLVVTGPVGAGKSTFIRTVSEIEVVDTDRRATDETAQMKRSTTVAFDFGRLQFNAKMALHLYGTPGQSRFDFMWDILIRKAHAYIVLVSANHPAEFRQAKLILNFMKQRSRAPMIIGLTHEDCEGAWSTENIAVALGFPVQQAPIFVSVNATNKRSVAQAVVALLREFASQSAQKKKVTQSRE